MNYTSSQPHQNQTRNLPRELPKNPTKESEDTKNMDSSSHKSSQSQSKTERQGLQNDSSVSALPPKISKIEKCQLHSKKFKYICWDHQEKICSECGLFGQHIRPKCTDIRSLDALTQAIDPTKKYCEDLLSKIHTFKENIEKSYQEQKEATLSRVKERFRELSFIITAKETQFIYEINSFYDKEIERLKREVGESSFTNQIITQKISEYQQITQMNRPFELLEEDFSSVYKIIQTATSPQNIAKIDQMLQGLKQNIDSTLTAQVSTLEKINLATEDLNLIHEESDFKFCEKLSSMEKLEKYKSAFAPGKIPDSSKNDITIEGNRVILSYPFSASITQNLDALQGMGENISLLHFKISTNVEKVSKEDISTLCCMRSKLVKIRDIKITIEKISDEALLDVFSCLFWKNQSLEGIDLSCQKGGLFEKGLLHLAENILPSANQLTSLRLVFEESRVSIKAYNSLAQSVSKLAENLVVLIWFVNCEKIDLKAFQKLFVPMPNLKAFLFQVFNSRAFDDNALETFISNTLPSLKNLRDFVFYMENSKVTDISVKKLLNTFPQNWFPILTRFKFGLGNTSITDESLKNFIDEDLKKFEALDDFEISAENSHVHYWIEQELSQWKKKLSQKKK